MRADRGQTVKENVKKKKKVILFLSSQRSYAWLNANGFPCEHFFGKPMIQPVVMR